jgi:arabinose-5-phosphate isomerase
LHVADIQHTGSEVPCVTPETPVLMALLEMSAKGLGMTAVCGPDRRVLGVFTDGDLRRAVDRGVDLQTTAVSALMTERFTGVSARMLAAEALTIMQEKRINALLVIRADDTLEGVLNMHDMLRAGVV